MKRHDSFMITAQFRQLMALSHQHDSFHELIDAVSEVPVLLEQFDVLITSRDIIPIHLWTNIFNSSLAVLEKLYNHNKKFIAENELPLYWAAPSIAHNPADDAYENKLFPFAIQFKSLEIASQLLFWWAIVVQALCSMIDLYEQFYGSSAVPSSFETPTVEDGTGPEPLLNSRFPTISSVKEEAEKLARYICQSIEYCYKMENGTMGPQITAYAQWVVGSCFRKFQYKRELAWCLNIKDMRGPGFRHGLELMGFKESMFHF